MKKITLFIALLLTTLTSFCQDIITTRDGRQIQCKIDKISETEIDYYKWGDANGVVFSTALKNVKQYQFQNGKIFDLDKPKPIVNQNDNIEFNTGKVEQVKIKRISDTEIQYYKLSNLNILYTAQLSNVRKYNFKDKPEQPEKPIVTEQTTTQFVQAPVQTETTKKEVKVEEPVEKVVTYEKEKLPPPTQVQQAPKTTQYYGTPQVNTYSDMFLQGRSDAKLYYTGYKGAGTGTLLTSMLLSPLVGLIPAIACSSTPPKGENLTFPRAELARNPDYVSGYTFEAKKKKSNKVWSNWGIGTIVVMIVVASQYSK